ncbi:hypothetical protein J1N35_035346 [Gossypium stocksii]|uniref:Uncharacterized protein n=1 Tax=Gossypium stocksii TaxID=47602 RepID=A0A9D3UU38_9ROSI|nr:hypothetical protein J1N35_035346 [Gossypium stocksii]
MLRWNVKGIKLGLNLLLYHLEKGDKIYKLQPTPLLFREIGLEGKIHRLRSTLLLLRETNLQSSACSTTTQGDKASGLNLIPYFLKKIRFTAFDLLHYCLGRQIYNFQPVPLLLREIRLVTSTCSL